MLPIRSRFPVLRAAIVTAALASGAAAATSSFAAAPLARSQLPGAYRVQVGDFEVTTLSDGTAMLPVDKLLDQPAARTDAALRKRFLAAPVEMSFNAYLVNTGTRLVLVDTGAGAFFGPTLGRLVQALRAAGVAPEQVDDVLVTHMHPDHVGGLVADGKAVFPNAVVHADKRDADDWLSPATLARATGDAKTFAQDAQAALAPYIAAGRFQAFDGAVEVVPGITAVPAYGHTPGHSCYLVHSGGQRLLVVGDLIHVGAVQFDDPSVAIAFDSDRAAAAATRARVFGKAAKDGTLLAAAHLSFPGLGRLRAAGRSWQWIPADYTTAVK
ncbi:MAG TPA: MBL fold metallo-hydrolase [Burkholderiaceae bacterium]